MCKKFIMLFVLLMLTACGIFGSYYEAEPGRRRQRRGRTQAFSLRLSSGRTSSKPAGLVC